MTKTLMFSLATNKYNILYSDCIASHEKYAKKNDYDYLLIDKTNKYLTPSETGWLKIPLILKALDLEYDWIFFIDADCKIKISTPKIESLFKKNKSIYLTKGYSGRINSGVIIIRNTKQSKNFFSKILKNANKKIPKLSQAPYENGHIIFYSKNNPTVQIIDKKWNNNSDPNLNDYIKHFSRGSKVENLFSNYLRRILILTINFYLSLNKNQEKMNKNNQVNTQLLKQVAASYF